LETKDQPTASQGTIAARPSAGVVHQGGFWSVGSVGVWIRWFFFGGQLIFEHIFFLKGKDG